MNSWMFLTMERPENDLAQLAEFFGGASEIPPYQAWINLDSLLMIQEVAGVFALWHDPRAQPFTISNPEDMAKIRDWLKTRVS